MKKGKPKKGAKRSWCKKKLRQLFNVLSISNSARTVLFIILTVQPAAGMTPVLLIGPNPSDVAANAEKACTLLCKVALTANKFVNTKEGRTALFWLAWSGVAKGLQFTSLLAAPTYGTAAISVALVCSAVYTLETIIGPDHFVGLEFINGANTWCAKGYGLLSAAAILPKDAINIAIKLLEGMKSLS